LTTILTWQGDGFAVVASDSRTTGPYIDIGIHKIAEVGTYLLGCAGDVRALNILHHAFRPPPCKDSLHGKKLDDFITATFIPALRGAFDLYGYSMPTSHEDAQHTAQQDSHIVVVVNAVVYLIYEDYCWTRSKGRLGGVGSGSGFGMGAMEVLMRNWKTAVTPSVVRTVILQAMKTAARFDEYTSAPFHVHIQRNK